MKNLSTNIRLFCASICSAGGNRFPMARKRVLWIWRLCACLSVFFLLEMGWALKSKAKVVRFNEKQKSYLQSRFLQREKLGKKESGEAVAKDMRKARDAKNERLFSIEEFLTPQQSNSYFFSLCGQTKAAQWIGNWRSSIWVCCKGSYRKCHSCPTARIK